MEEDWDNLIILDACRYDQFEMLNTIPGRLEARTSLGSATLEFMMENFDGSAHYDTVYVTANPMYLYEEDADIDDAFYRVVDVWRSNWDGQYHTVHPEKMVEATLEAYERYPDKRLISHFIQPHYPFIGDAANEIGHHAGNKLAYRSALGKETEEIDPTVWELLEEGRVDERTVRRAYDENLEIVLSYVEELVDEFPEKTVVTSDHGNLIGERVAPFGRSMYGHPPNVYTDELRKVPWLVVEGETRKEVRSDTPAEADDEKSELVAERLAHLGYGDA